VKPKLVYVAGKYSAPSPYLVQRNIDHARYYAQEIALLGGYPVTPHLTTAHFDGIQTYDWWCDTTLELMRRCDAVFMLPAWGESKGARGEHMEALKLKLPVFYTLYMIDNWLNDK